MPCRPRRPVWYWLGNPARRHKRRRARYELPQLAHDVHRHGLELPLARVGDVILLRYSVPPHPHPEARGEEEVIAWELEKLRVLKAHEFGVRLEYDPDDGGPYVPEAEK
jgi:hypothetical protein